MRNNSVTRRMALGGVVAMGVAGGGAVALGAGGSSPNVFRGCLNDKTGVAYKLRVNPSSPPRCRRGDRRIRWNQAGRAGTPGATGPRGSTGHTGARGAAGHAGARGPTGPRGPKGDDGAAGATRVAVRSGTESVAHNVATTLGVQCEPGEVATGGGARLGTGGLGGVHLTRSQPSPVTGTPTGWEIIVANASGSTQEAGVYVICAMP